MPIHRKTRPDARMLRLTPEQKDTAYSHCQTLSIREGVRWLKEKFNLSTNRKTLGSWLQEQRIERSMAAELADLRDNQQGASLIKDVAPDVTPLTVANSVLFASAVFKEFRKPDGERDENRLIRYMDLALKARDLDIRASAVRLSLERFHLEAAKKSADSTGELQMGWDGGSEDRKKIQKAMDLVFGEEPRGFVSATGLPVAETSHGPMPG